MEAIECPECRYWFGLHTLPGLGKARLQKLINRFGSAKAAWTASAKAWNTIPGFGPQVTATALAERTDERLDRDVRVLKEHSVELVCRDNLFPSRLAHIHDSPTLLYVKGTLEKTDARAVAIVGSRKASAHAIGMAEQLAGSLAASGITVVSGLAAGVDAAAHRGALKAGGRTVAVLGSGLDRVYPPSHTRLASDIARRGALVTEYPLGTEPHPTFFPMRNRIIAGWAIALIIVEAPERSGALITADLALEENRDVFVVPGDAGRTSCLGSNRLLREGAGAVLSADDVISAIRMELETDGWRPPVGVQRAPAGRRAANRAGEASTPAGSNASEGTHGALPELAPDDLEQLLLTLLDDGGDRRVDGLVARSGRPAADVQRALFQLEMAGFVRAVATGEYVRAARGARVRTG